MCCTGIKAVSSATTKSTPSAVATTDPTCTRPPSLRRAEGSGATSWLTSVGVR